MESINTWNPARELDDETFLYIDLSAVDQDSKVIIGAREISCHDAPSRARQLVSGGDILVSTVRPNLNGVAHVPKHLDGATASTGFCVLRPKASLLDARYLFNWTRSPQFIEDMVRKATGASYPAVSDRIILGSCIPLPPLPKQRRIAEVLERAENFRTQRKNSIKALEEFSKSIFHEMFVANASESWPSATVADIAVSEKGSIRTGPFGSQLLHEEFVDSGIAVLGIDNVVSNEFRWSERRYITEEKYRELKRYTVNPGDVLITIMGTCGRCAVVPDGIPISINTKHLCCITLDTSKCLPEYLHSCFLRHPTAKKHLEQAAKGAIMAGLNMGIISALPINLPPLEIQKEFVWRLASIRRMKEALSSSASRLDALFASLQHRAFRGELT